MTTQASWPKPLARVGDHELLGVFACGQSCLIYLARSVAETSSGAIRVLKVPVAEQGQSSAISDMLVAEAELLASIQHPNVVAVHGFGRAGGGYIALEYIEGDDLQSLQSHGEPVAARIAAAIMLDVLAGLEALHTRADALGQPSCAVHQAPHARHIVVGCDGRARLIDLSHARLLRADAEASSATRLGMASLAPEQILAPDKVDVRTDLFVLGATFWEALTGQTLFKAATPALAAREVLAGRIAAPSTLGPAAVAAFDQVCLRALALDPDLRWSSAREMRAAVREAAQALGGVASASEIGSWVGARARAGLEVRRALSVGTAVSSTDPAVPNPVRPSFRPMRPSSKPPTDSVRPDVAPAAAKVSPATQPSSQAALSSPPQPLLDANPALARPSTTSPARDARGAEPGSRGTSPPPLEHARASARPQPIRPSEDAPNVVPRSQPSAPAGRRSDGAPAVEAIPGAAVTPASTAAAGQRTGGSPVAPARRELLPREDAPASAREVMWMSAVAILCVLAGEGLLRLWFGSPYGEPRQLGKAELLGAAPEAEAAETP